jgi:RimJ/RimL family protein N-acetyltransferase
MSGSLATVAALPGLSPQAHLLSFTVGQKLHRLKQSGWNTALLPDDAPTPATLSIFTHENLHDQHLLEALTAWKAATLEGFTSTFTPTAERTRTWARNQLLVRDDRALFILRSAEVAIGHIGLSNFDDAVPAMEMDSVIRGEASSPADVMHLAGRAVLDFAERELGLRTVMAGVLSNNVSGLNFFHRLRFQPVGLVGLAAQAADDGLQWKQTTGRAERFLVTLAHKFGRDPLGRPTLRLRGWQ